MSEHDTKRPRPWSFKSLKEYKAAGSRQPVRLHDMGLDDYVDLGELLNQPTHLSDLHKEISSKGCADCGRNAPLYGPVNFDGEYYEPGDFVCRTCAEDRGVRVPR